MADHGAKAALYDALAKLRTITRDDLRARLRDGDVVVLDVRPEAEYAAGHVRGAISTPAKAGRRS